MSSELFFLQFCKPINYEMGFQQIVSSTSWPEFNKGSGAVVESVLDSWLLFKVRLIAHWSWDVEGMVGGESVDEGG